MECGWPVSETFVGKTAQDSVSDIAVATASTTPVVCCVGVTFQHCIVSGGVLAGAGEVEVVESAKCREVRGRESRLGRRGIPCELCRNFHHRKALVSIWVATRTASNYPDPHSRLR